MKYINYLIGIAVFSVVAILFFKLAANVGNNYESRDSSQYTTLSGAYDYTPEVNNESSVIRSVADKLKGGRFDIVSAGFAASEGALDGIKAIFGSVNTVERISNQVKDDTAGLGVDPIIFSIPKILMGIFLTVVILAMVWRFKPDTD